MNLLHTNYGNVLDTSCVKSRIFSFHSRFTLVALSLCALLLLGAFTSSVWGGSATATYDGTTAWGGRYYGPDSFKLEKTHVTFAIMKPMKQYNYEAIISSHYFYLSGDDESEIRWWVDRGYTINVTSVVTNAQRAKSGSKGKYKTSKKSDYKYFLQSESGWGDRSLDDAAYFGLGNAGKIYINAESKEIQFKNININYTISANTYTVSFNGNGSTKGSVASIGATYDQNVALAANGYRKHQYKVSYNTAGGSAVSPDSTLYTFLGWNTKDDGTGTTYSAGATLTTPNFTSTQGDTYPLYAKWSATVASASITLPAAPTKDGYNFDGWYIGEARIGGAGGSFTPTSDTTITARWSSKYTPVFSFTGSKTTLKVDEVLPNAFSFEHVVDSAASYRVISISAINDGSGKVIEYDKKTNSITAINAGQAKIVIDQALNDTIFAGHSDSVTITVTKNVTSFSGSAYNMLVDGTQTANYSYTNTSAAQPTDDSDDDFYYAVEDVSFTNSSKNSGANLVTFNPSTKLITACNAGTGKISLRQKETYKYTGDTVDFNVAVYKYNSVFSGKSDLAVLVDETVTSGYAMTYTKPDGAYIGAANHAAGVPALNEGSWHYALAHTVQTDSTRGSDNPEIVIAYNPSTKVATGKNKGVCRVTLTQEETYKYNSAETYFDVAVSKHVPVFTWNTPAQTFYYKSDLAHIFRSTNTEIPVTSVSSNPNVATVGASDSTLHIYNVAESDCEITMTQIENYKWTRMEDTYAVRPVDNLNKLPLTYSSSSNSSYTYERVSPDNNNKWKASDELQLGNNTDEGEHHVILQFEGVPDSLYFQFGLNASTFSGSGTTWHVIQGSTLETLTDTIYSEPRGNTSWSNMRRYGLLPTTRYVKLSYTGTKPACYKGIQITALADKFQASEDELNFGLQGQEFGEQVMTVNFDHVNAGRITNVKIIGADAAKYSVTPTTIPGTGRECYGTTTLRVAFDNGETERAEDVPYSAQLVVYDNNDHTDTVNLVGYRYGKSIPVFTFNPNHMPYYFGDTIHVPAVSRNTQAKLTYSTSNSSIADIVNGKLVIKSTAAEVTITVHQVETEDFRAHDEGFTFTPRQRPSLNVPFMMNERIYNGSCVTPGSKCGWQDDDCIRSGNFQSAVYWGEGNDKKIIIEFGGTPDKLSFELKNWAPAIEERWRVEESSDGSNWTEIWYSSDAHDGSSWDPVGPIQLSPTSHFVRLSYGGNYMGYFNNISITALDGVKYMMTDDNKYLSRGGAYGTRAVVDDYGVPVRVTRYAPDTMNTTFYTKVQFMDSRDYLFESDSKVYTDAGGRSGDQWIQSVVGGKVLVQNVGSSKYITVADNKLEVTSDADAATRWTAEDYTVHADRIEAKLNEMAARAAGPDFGTDVNTLEKMRTQVALQKFVKDTITIPTVAVDEQGGEYRTSAGTNAVYDNTIEGLEPGLYRLTIQALYRPAPSSTDWTNHDNGMESVVAYIYANESKFPIKSIFDETGRSATAIGAGKDTVCGGYHYAVNKAAAAKVFEDRNSYLHDVYVYVNADEGKTTGTLSYGIKNPSYVPGAWLAYGNATLELIKRRKYIFDGGAGTTVWNTLSNWEYEGGVPAEAPGPYDAVIIRDTVIVAGQVSVYSVTIEGSNLMTVAPTGGLTVGDGGVVNSASKNLVLQVDQDAESETRGQVGYLRISPKCAVAMPQATMEYLRLGYTNCSVTDGTAEITGYSTWQYLGCPIQAAGKKIKTVIAGWVNSWDESTGTWVNNRATATVSPFIGFANSQDLNSTGALSKFKGQLVDVRSYDVSLTYTDSESSLKGWNLLANSFSAPMVISQMDFPTQTDSTVYLFNTGSTEHASAEDDGEGTYTSVPAKFAGETVTIKGMSYTFPNTIPSMQGFFVKAKANTTLTIDYTKTVWNATYTASTNKPLRARAEQSENAENEYRAMFVSMEANGQRDIVRIIESEKFSTSIDGGYDAQILPVGNFNIFTIEDDAHLSVNATNSIIGTRVGVRTGEETAYTLTFNYEDDDLALVDVETGEELEIFDGMQYTFFAEPNTEITERFMIVERADAPSVTTGVESANESVKAHKFVKDDQVFILKNGVLYNMMGTIVR